MADRKPCARCDQPTPTIDNIIDVTSWAGIQMKTETETATRRSVRIFTADIYGRGSKGGARNLMADEEKPLCHECSYLLIGRFMQGRSVDALPGKEVRRG